MNNGTVDSNGRTMLTTGERMLLEALGKLARSGALKHKVSVQHRVDADDVQCHIGLAIPDVKLGVEVDGDMFHQTVEQLARDMRRDLALRREGWKVMRYTDEEVKRTPDAMASKIVGTI